MLLLSVFISEITNNHCWHLQVEKKSKKAKKYLIAESDRMRASGYRQGRAQAPTHCASALRCRWNPSKASGAAQFSKFPLVIFLLHTFHINFE